MLISHPGRRHWSP